MNFLQFRDKSSTRVKASDISETFAKASPTHSAAVNNLHNNNNRFIGSRIMDSL